MRIPGYIYIVLMIPEFEFESSHTKNSLSRSSFFSRRIERDDAFFFFFFFSRGVFFFGVSQRWCWPSKGGVIAEREREFKRQREREGFVWGIFLRGSILAFFLSLCFHKKDCPRFF